MIVFISGPPSSGKGTLSLGLTNQMRHNTLFSKRESKIILNYMDNEPYFEKFWRSFNSMKKALLLDDLVDIFEDMSINHTLYVIIYPELLSKLLSRWLRRQAKYDITLRLSEEVSYKFYWLITRTIKNDSYYNDNKISCVKFLNSYGDMIEKELSKLSKYYDVRDFSYDAIMDVNEASWVMHNYPDIKCYRLIKSKSPLHNLLK